jgi:hypothetical protein
MADRLMLDASAQPVRVVFEVRWAIVRTDGKPSSYPGPVKPDAWHGEYFDTEAEAMEYFGRTNTEDAAAVAVGVGASGKFKMVSEVNQLMFVRQLLSVK